MSGHMPPCVPCRDNQLAALQQGRSSFKQLNADCNKGRSSDAQFLTADLDHVLLAILVLLLKRAGAQTLAILALLVTRAGAQTHQVRDAKHCYLCRPWVLQQDAFHLPGQRYEAAKHGTLVPV